MLNNKTLKANFVFTFSFMNNLTDPSKHWAKLKWKQSPDTKR